MNEIYTMEQVAEYRKQCGKATTIAQRKRRLARAHLEELELIRQYEITMEDLRGEESDDVQQLYGR